MYTVSDHMNSSFDFSGKASFELAVGCTGKARFSVSSGNARFGLAVDCTRKACFELAVGCTGL